MNAAGVSDEPTTDGGDGGTSIELTPSSSAVADDTQHTDTDLENNNQKEDSFDSEASLPNDNSSSTIRQRRATGTTSNNTSQSKWEQQSHLEAILQNSKKAPMRTVSYELYDSEFWNARKVSIKNKVGTILHQHKCHLLLNTSIFGIGFVTALVGFFISWSSEKLFMSVFDNEAYRYDMNKNVYVKYLGWSVLFAVLAFVPVAFIRPVAAGSGIAEAKAVLNGIKIPACTDILSAACKATSVIFAVASSLPVGLEGPLIFIGMAIGENAYRFFPKHYAELHSWRVRRDLAATGTAAGVSAAFLSPIGGILFVAEEGASYLTANLLSRCFAAAITVVIFEYLLNIVQMREYDAAIPFTLRLSRFNGLPGQKGHEATPEFKFYDYFVIAIIGVLGGLMGACWIEISKCLARLRQRHIKSWWKKFVEILFLAVFASTLLAWLPKIPGLSKCQNLANTLADDRFFVRFNCDEFEYNDLATLLRNPLPTGINLLFWEPYNAFSTRSCVMSGLTMSIILLLTFGCSIAMGIFIPLMYVGAAFGRAFATAVPNQIFGVTTYAIIGSAASLNGVIRVLMSLTIIIVETTSLATFVSPVMVACLFSKIVGNALFKKEGIYDEILHLRGVPFLEAEFPEIAKMEVIRAKDIMSEGFVKLTPVMRIADILLVLQERNQLDFVVIDSDGLLLGSINRTVLITVICNQSTWSNVAEEEPLTESQFQEAYEDLSYDDFDFDSLENMTNKELSDRFSNDEDCQYYVNIAHFMKLSPIVFGSNGSAERAYELFRTHGLRQLIIVDEDERRPVGVLTRYVILKALEGGEQRSANVKEEDAFAYQSSEVSNCVEEERVIT